MSGRLPENALPRMIYGTAWKKEKTTLLTTQALEAGFRAIDTANQAKHYDEVRVGEAIKLAYLKGLKREDLFLQTKFTSVSGQDHRLPYDPKSPLAVQVNQSFESSLQHLHTHYLDAFLLHGPHSHPDWVEEDWEVWRAMESLARQGKVRLIGVSNVNANQLQTLLAGAGIKPSVVQNRCYASRKWDESVRGLCREHGIMYQGFSLLTANPHVLQSTVVVDVAKSFGATPAQIIFAFSLTLGMTPLTGTSSPQHLQEDLAALSLQLTAKDIAKIQAIA